MAKIPCFLCGASLELKKDKREKLYFICNPCGVQAFVRRANGIKRLENLLRNLKKRDFQFEIHTHSFLEVCAILTEIEDFKGQIKKLEDKRRIFSSDPDNERAIEALKERVNALLSILEKHAENVQEIAK